MISLGKEELLFPNGDVHDKPIILAINPEVYGLQLAVKNCHTIKFPAKLQRKADNRSHIIHWGKENNTIWSFQEEKKQEQSNVPQMQKNLLAKIK